MPDYYRKLWSDLWFQLWDIRRFVAGDTPAVIEKLNALLFPSLRKVLAGGGV
jgi:hypothetical protein